MADDKPDATDGGAQLAGVAGGGAINLTACTPKEFVALQNS